LVTFFFAKVRRDINQGMRGEKGFHTIRDSNYHKEKDTEKTWGGGNGSKHVKVTINHQLQKIEPFGLVS